jgi:hypothetical protein
VQVGYGIPDIRPYRRTVVATLLVELYASFISVSSGRNDRLKSSRYAKMNFLYRNFRADRIQDLRVPTAVSILTSRRCCQAARAVTVFAGDCKRAGELCLLHANSVDSLALLDLLRLKGSHTDVAELLIFISGRLANTSPRRLTCV